jgi:hypothetical protein
MDELPPYLPPLEARRQQRDAELALGVLERLLELPEGKLRAKLEAVPAPLALFLATFLRFSPRSYERCCGNGEEEAGDDDWPEQGRLEECVLCLLMRMIKELDTKALRDADLFSLPMLLDMSALYGPGRLFCMLAEVVKMTVDRIPSTTGDLEAAAAATSQVLDEIGQKVSSVDSLGQGASEELSVYLADILGSISWLIGSCTSLSRSLAGGGFMTSVASVYEGALLTLTERAAAAEEGGKAAAACRSAAKDALRLVWRVLGASNGDDVFSVVMELASVGSGGIMRDCDKCFGVSKRLNQLVDGDLERAQYLGSVLRQLMEAYSPARPLVPPTPPAQRASGSDPPRPPTGAPPSRERISQMVGEIQAVLGGPHAEGGMGVGEGYAEACLQLMGWSVESVVGALLDGNPPPQLATVPRSLAKAWKGKRGDNDVAYERDEEAAQISAERLREAERREEMEAFALEMFNREYDDDYDDQWDEYEPQVGGTTEGGLDQMEAALQYNKAVRAAEAEEQFWHSMRNTNKPSSRNGESGDENEDGGGSGGTEGENGGENGNAPASRRRGQGAAASPAALTPEQAKKKAALQRRRKDQNKGAVGNHHRRDRAARKGAF